MKRIFAAVMVLLCTMMFTVSCGDSKEADKPEDSGVYEVAMLISGKDVEDGAFNQKTWKSVSSFCEKKELTCQYYTSEKNSRDAYLASVKTAVDNGAGIVIFAGSDFETAAYDAQKKYPDISFLLIDGMPHDKNDKYEMGSNMIGIMFAEEEAGFLAGYAAVKDGYTQLGFMGGKETPSIKRYGYGFVQGAETAASEADMKEKVGIRYSYAGTFDESDDVKKTAEKWYKKGTQVIFACGGAMGRSVMNAAEAADGKVIGVDVDQSSLSETVITSAEKNISSAVENVLRDYASGKFTGGTAFNYAAKNDGVKLQMKNSRFSTFSSDAYKEIFCRLKNGKIDLKKDTEADSAERVTGEHTEIIK